MNLNNNDPVHFWEKLVSFAKWCENHHVPEMILDLIFKLLYWWFIHR